MIFIGKNLLLTVGISIMSIIIVIAIFAPFIASYDPIKDANLLNSLESPNEKFLLGTDRQGRDLLSRIIFGTRIALLVGIVAQSLNTAIGLFLGIWAGLSGGAIDDIIMAFTNTILSIPGLILALVIMAALGPGLVNVLIALGFTQWTYTCRVARSQVLSLKEKDFVQASRALGASTWRIVFRHVLPHILSPVLVIATLGVGIAILMESSLSFLGVGTQPPTPSWGLMLSSGRIYIYTAPWITIFPGIAVMVTVLGLNLIGDGLRDMLDPRLRHQARK